MEKMDLFCVLYRYSTDITDTSLTTSLVQDGYVLDRMSFDR